MKTGRLECSHDSNSSEQLTGWPCLSHTEQTAAEPRRTCKRFKFNQAFRAGHLIFHLKLHQNSGSVAGPHSRPPTYSNPLTEPLKGWYLSRAAQPSGDCCVCGRSALPEASCGWGIRMKHCGNLKPKPLSFISASQKPIHFEKNVMSSYVRCSK